MTDTTAPIATLPTALTPPTTEPPAQRQPMAAEPETLSALPPDSLLAPADSTPPPPTDSPPAAIPPETSAADAASADQAEPDPNVSKQRMLRFVLNDSLVIIAAHVHSNLLRDTKFRERVVRYLYAVAERGAKPAVFTVSCKNHVWSEINELSADSRECEVLFPTTNRIAALFAQKKADSFVLAIDFIHTAAPLAVVRYIGMLTLNRAPLARDYGKNGGAAPAKVAERVAQQVAHSEIVEQSVKWHVLSMSRDATTAEHAHFKSILDSLLKERTDIATEFAQSLFLATIYEACILYDIHSPIIAADKAATAANKPLDPATCYVVICSGNRPLRVETLKASELVDRLKPVAGNQPHPLADLYGDALKKMSVPREPYVAVVIVVHSFDGPIATAASGSTAYVDMLATSAGVDKERTARRERAAEQQAELAKALQ